MLRTKWSSRAICAAVVCAALVPAASATLLVNGGFEDGQTGWTGFAGGADRKSVV